MSMDDTQMREFLAQLFAKQEQQKGMMGFDQKMMDRMMSDPEAMEAGAEMAGLMDDNTAMGMMRMGEQNQVPNGGRLGWTEALSNGIDKGIGLYNMLNAQKVKANALRAMGPKDKDVGKPSSMITDPDEIDAMYGQ